MFRLSVSCRLNVLGFGSHLRILIAPGFIVREVTILTRGHCHYRAGL